MLATGLMQRLMADPQRAAAVHAQLLTVKHLESLGQLLLRKLDMEAKYLNRLEGLFLSCCGCLTMESPLPLSKFISCT